MTRAVTLSLVLLASCFSARGFDRGALLRQVRTETPVVTDEEIAKVLAVRPQLRTPFALAVYFRPLRAEGPYSPHRGALWTTEDKDAVHTRLRGLVGAAGLAEVIPMGNEALNGDDVKSIRLAAARYGADAVLVVNGAGQVDRYNNAVSALYWTIVGLLVVPGTKADALFVASATMWDVRNEYLYASAEAEGTARSTGTPFTVHDEHVLAHARQRSMVSLGEEIERRVQSLSATAAR